MKMQQLLTIHSVKYTFKQKMYTGLRSEFYFYESDLYT